MRQKLTVLIPCKDEVSQIASCIASLGNVADEILVADSGSTDGTLEYIQHAALAEPSLRIIQREYINPSSFKNWAIPQASHPWILAIDADERLTEKLREEIKQTLSTEPIFDAYQIPRKNIFLGKMVHFSGWQHDAPFRLFHRDRCRYDQRRIHEHLMVASEKTATMKASIQHNAGDSLEKIFAKSIRYGSSGADDLQAAGKDSRAIALIVRPMFRFFRHYIWKQGFRDGSVGLLLSCLAAQGAFIKYALLWSRRHQHHSALQPAAKTSRERFATAMNEATCSPASPTDNPTMNESTSQFGHDESEKQPRPLTMPGIHQKVQAVVDQLPRGSLLDVGAGEGAFSKWARQNGFSVHATDVNEKEFCLRDIPFTQTNFNGRWPFKDNTFDLVVSIEVLEHVENHYHFISECCRICKPTGRIVMSTPNCHSIESRLNVLLSGFDDCAPRPIDYSENDPEQIYMQHIHPAPLANIELGLRRCGFEIESTAFNRHRKLSSALLPVAYPLIWWRTYRQLILSEKDLAARERNRKLLQLFLNKGLLTGRISIFTCRQIEQNLAGQVTDGQKFRHSA
ncbi:MAG: methyltransferase domain-containing protein [Planctomycetota bacterium]|nr:methyltransferase domain-containing protein [Planctomycetota bacterium]